VPCAITTWRTTNNAWRNATSHYRSTHNTSRPWRRSQPLWSSYWNSNRHLKRSKGPTLFKRFRPPLIKSKTFSTMFLTSTSLIRHWKPRILHRLFLVFPIWLVRSPIITNLDLLRLSVWPKRGLLNRLLRISRQFIIRKPLKPCTLRELFNFIVETVLRLKAISPKA